MCMFLGCYILLLYIPLLLIDRRSTSLADEICMWYPWFSGLGLPFPLILATLLLKMLRVYMVFSHPIFNPYSFRKKLCSDGVLFMLVLLLSSPTVLILTVWAILDYYSNLRLVRPQKSHLEIHDVCHCNHAALWLGMLLVYFFILLVAVIVVAFKTSKIRYKHFRDTKTTNIYAFLVSFLYVMTLFYWYFFASLEYNGIAEYITLYVGSILIVVSCQLTLFVPKLYPPIVRWLMKSKCVQ